MRCSRFWVTAPSDPDARLVNEGDVDGMDTVTDAIGIGCSYHRSGREKKNKTRRISKEEETRRREVKKRRRREEEEQRIREEVKKSRRGEKK